MEIIQVYTFAGVGFGRHANLFLQETAGQFVIERIETSQHHIVLIVRMKLGMAQELWETFTRIIAD